MICHTKSGPTGVLREDFEIRKYFAYTFDYNPPHFKEL